MHLTFVWSGLESRVVAINLASRLQQWVDRPCHQCGLQGARECVDSALRSTLAWPPHRALLCVTPDNKDDLWLAHATGALGSKLPAVDLAVLRWRLEPSAVMAPLRRYRSYTLSLEGLRALIDDNVPSETKEQAGGRLERAWPSLERELARMVDSLRRSKLEAPVAEAWPLQLDVGVPGREPDGHELEGILGKRLADYIFAGGGFHQQSRRLHEAFVRDIVHRTLQITAGNLAQTALLLGVPRPTCYRLVRRSGIPVAQFKPGGAFAQAPADPGASAENSEVEPAQ